MAPPSHPGGAPSPSWGHHSSPLLAVIKCIYLPPTYLHFIQDIEDRCLLLMSFTSFVDLSFHEHRMMESSIWTKIHTYLNYVQNQRCSWTIWHEGTTWHKAWDQPTNSGAGWPHTLVRPARSRRISKNHFHHMSKLVRVVSNVGKAVEQLNMAA
jgi:hypothetical protein